jgi:hypothetical protein
MVATHDNYGSLGDEFDHLKVYNSEEERFFSSEKGGSKL